MTFTNTLNPENPLIRRRKTPQSDRSQKLKKRTRKKGTNQGIKREEI